MNTTYHTPAWASDPGITLVRLERSHRRHGDVVAIADPRGKYGMPGKYPRGTEVGNRPDGRADLMGLLGL